MWTFADANLMHDSLSGKAVTAILHFFNKTPIEEAEYSQHCHIGDAARTAISNN